MRFKNWVSRCFVCSLAVSFIISSGVASAQPVKKVLDANVPDDVIPKPLMHVRMNGRFEINPQTVIVVDPGNQDMQSIGRQLSDYLKQRSGIDLPVTSSYRATNAIILTTKGAIDTLGEEGYSLKIRSAGIIIAATGAPGIFYGTQTIDQLLPLAQGSQKTVNVPAADIIDRPRFAWRGLMLDVGRYFYSVDFLKKFIDNMARHKLNTFHWHLTEDHGWRIEIKKYPALTSIGAQREGTQYGRSQHEVNQQPHWGYYTQEQIKEVVAYASKRYVTIVPEIEMPGHTLAALVSKPELSCTGGPFSIPVNWGIQKDIYCAGNEQTFAFLEDVLSEVAGLFPGPFVHIGGDEAPKDRWKACPKCQDRIKQNGLKGEHELQSYFIKRIEKFLLTKNKRIIGWDEILEGGLAPNAWVMSWRGTAGGIAAARQQHGVVMSPNEYMYLDYYQGEPYLEPVAIGGFLPLQKVYNYEPVPEELSATETGFIKGVQGNIWSEYIHSPEKVEYMTFPRAAAVAEVGWTTPQLKNYNDFLRRMEFAYQRYDLEGINYSRSAYQVSYTVATDTLQGDTKISLHSDSYEPQIRYTTDGSEPTSRSSLYNGPFILKVPVSIKAACYRDGKPIGKTSIRSVVLPK